MRHLVFFDGKCGVCDWIVQTLIQVDKKESFLFAPLQGKTANTKKLPKKAVQADSLILIENYNTENEQIYIYGKAAFRILWLLGGFWKLLGSISFLPSGLYDWAYRLFAKNRHRFIAKESCPIPDPTTKHRFLD